VRIGTFATPPPGPVARRAAVASLAGTVLFVALLVALHGLRLDLVPSWRFISEYEMGPYGSLMRLAFAALAVGTTGAAVAVAPQARSLAGYVGGFQLAASAAGMILAALYAPDAPNHLHDLGAMLDQVPFAALFFAWSLSRNERWRSRRRALWGLALLNLVGLAVFVASMALLLPRNGGRPGPTVPVGWQNRLMVLMQAVWLWYVARQTLVLAREADGAAPPSPGRRGRPSRSPRAETAVAARSASAAFRARRTARCASS
jgi:hypothetical protein